MYPFFGRCIGNESEYRIFLEIMISWIIILWNEERERSEEGKNRGEIVSGIRNSNVRKYFSYCKEFISDWNCDFLPKGVSFHPLFL